MNPSISFEGLWIYGLLTDLMDFAFYYYDPKASQFFKDETILVDVKRCGFMLDTIHGVCLGYSFRRLMHLTVSYE